MKKSIILKWIVLVLAISINVFILVNAFVNGEASAKESNTIAQTAADVVNTVKPETVTPSNFNHFAYDIRKLFGHFGLFAASGLFSSWALYLFVKETKLGYFLWQLLITLLFGFIMAISSEFVQIFIDGYHNTLSSFNNVTGASACVIVLGLRDSPRLA